jgi:hypothetical protein
MSVLQVYCSYAHFGYRADLSKLRLHLDASFPSPVEKRIVTTNCLYYLLRKKPRQELYIFDLGMAVLAWHLPGKKKLRMQEFLNQSYSILKDIVSEKILSNLHNIDSNEAERIMRERGISPIMDGDSPQVSLQMYHKPVYATGTARFPDALLVTRKFSEKALEEAILCFIFTQSPYLIFSLLGVWRGKLENTMASWRKLLIKPTSPILNALLLEVNKYRAYFYSTMTAFHELYWLRSNTIFEYVNPQEIEEKLRFRERATVLEGFKNRLEELFSSFDREWEYARLSVMQQLSARISRYMLLVTLITFAIGLYTFGTRIYAADWLKWLALGVIACIPVVFWFLGRRSRQNSQLRAEKTIITNKMIQTEKELRDASAALEYMESLQIVGDDTRQLYEMLKSSVSASEAKLQRLNRQMGKLTGKRKK